MKKKKSYFHLFLFKPLTCKARGSFFLLRAPLLALQTQRKKGCKAKEGQSEARRL